jgi:capsular exopolysaccharide synthesis family protein
MGRYIRKTSVENLDLITCGTYPPNPSELLASQRNKKVLAGLHNHYDIIILDGAPIGGLADSVILSSLVDEVLIVTKDGATSKNDLIATRDALRKVDANIAGIVFNTVNHRSAKYYSYYGVKESK